MIDGILAFAREEADTMTREQLTKVYLLWRGYALQWQEWADSKIDQLGLTNPEVMLGRRGSQVALSMVLAMVDGTALPTLGGIQGAFDSFEREDPDHFPPEEIDRRLDERFHRFVSNGQAAQAAVDAIVAEAADGTKKP